MFLLFVLFLVPCVSADSVSFLDKINGTLENDAGFGWSTSLYGDFLVVGADSENMSGSNRGAVYVFKRNSSDDFNFLQKLNGTLENDAYFGVSVSLSGDYLSVGAYQEDMGGGGRGAAYVFKRNSSDDFNLISKLNGTLEDGAIFGNSVSLHGDYLSVAASYEDMGGSERGSVYVFKRNSSDDFNLISKLNGSLENGARFGSSVSLFGDYLSVSSYTEDMGGTGRGSVYVFKRNSSDDFNFAQKINGTLENNSYFGWGISLYGDYLAAGSYYEDMGGSNRGSTYVFKRNSSDDFNLVSKLNGTLEDSARFGYSVSLYGDYLIAGAYEEDLGGSDRGAVYVFKRNSSDDFNFVSKLNGTLEDGALFGIFVSLHGNYFGVGAFGEDMGGADRGAAYVFKIVTSSVVSSSAPRTLLPFGGFAMFFVLLIGVSGWLMFS